MADPNTIALLRRMYAQALMQPQIVPSAALQRPLVPRQAYPPGVVPSAQLPYSQGPALVPMGQSLSMLGGTAPYIPGGSSISPLMQQMLMQRLDQSPPQVPPGVPRPPPWRGGYDTGWGR